MTDDPTAPQDSSASDDAGAAARIAELEAQVTQLQEQLAKLTDLAARAQADLQNAKVRMRRDADDLRRYAAESIIRKLLPVVDNFQRAFTHLPKELESTEWVKGVFAIEQNLLRELTELGLQKMDVLGQQADTARVEILTVGEGKEGEVIEVFESGYELNGKVLRPAKVKVGGGDQ
jgi:molecular chaperone GrpE